MKQERVEICSAVERIAFKPKPSWMIVVALIFQYGWAFVLLHSGPVSLMVVYSRTLIQDGLLSLDWDLWMSRDSAADSVVQWYSLWPRCEILSILNKNSITHTQHIKKPIVVIWVDYLLKIPMCAVRVFKNIIWLFWFSKRAMVYRLVTLINLKAYFNLWPNLGMNFRFYLTFCIYRGNRIIYSD